METSTSQPSRGSPVSVVRFHLGSGINGNMHCDVHKSISAYNIVRFHLGSGINGNLLLEHHGLHPELFCPLSSRKWN